MDVGLPVQLDLALRVAVTVGLGALLNEAAAVDAFIAASLF